MCLANMSHAKVISSTVIYAVFAEVWLRDPSHTFGWFVDL